jgi:hypothetical protein
MAGNALEASVTGSGQTSFKTADETVLSFDQALSLDSNTGAGATRTAASDNRKETSIAPSMPGEFGNIVLVADALRDAAATLGTNATMDNYMAVLRTNVARFDPATYSAFYRQLYHEFNKDYVQQH